VTGPRVYLCACRRAGLLPDRDPGPSPWAATLDTGAWRVRGGAPAPPSQRPGTHPHVIHPAWRTKPKHQTHTHTDSESDTPQVAHLLVYVPSMHEPTRPSPSRTPQKRAAAVSVAARILQHATYLLPLRPATVSLPLSLFVCCLFVPLARSLSLVTSLAHASALSLSLAHAPLPMLPPRSSRTGTRQRVTTRPRSVPRCRALAAARSLPQPARASAKGCCAWGSGTVIGEVSARGTRGREREREARGVWRRRRRPRRRLGGSGDPPIVPQPAVSRAVRQRKRGRGGLQWESPR